MNIEANITFTDIDVLNIVHEYLDCSVHNKENFEEAICEFLGYSNIKITNIEKVAKECIKAITNILTFDDN